MAYLSEESNDEKCWELANLYVNQTGYNASEAYRRYAAAHGLDATDGARSNACRYFKANPKIQKYIEEIKAENRAKYGEMRDINIARLNDIADDETTRKSDRISAIKELNNMFGYNSHNINVDANQQIEVIIE